MMVHARMLKRTYDWCINAADKPYALWILAAVSFAESSFFPIPPDVMLLPMSLARPDRAYHFAAVCTLTSVAGGLLGYAIGYFLYESLGLWLMQLYGYGAKIEWFQQQYREWGAWFILIKGLTPIPYKLVTITSGFAHYSLFWFTLLSIVTRGARFFILAGLLGRYGVQIRGVLDRHLNAVVAIETNLDPYELLHRGQEIEARAERERAERWGPRTLDVDVLLVGDERVDNADLTIPHPRMWERGFVLAPLRDVAPEELQDEWSTLVPAYEALVDAVEEAGIDPAEYQPDDLPEGLPGSEARRLASVASKLASPRVTQAAAGIQDHADAACGVAFTG